jgi:uncharacterized protein (DUF1501 family)
VKEKTELPANEDDFLCEKREDVLFHEDHPLSENSKNENKECVECDRAEKNEENTRIDRREFLNLSLYTVGSVTVSSLLGVSALAPSLSFSQQTKNTKFIFVFLRGGADALSFLLPRDTATINNLERMRPTTKWLADEIMNDTNIGGFRLNSSLNSFSNSDLLKDTLFFMGLGSKNTTRSHFSQQDYIEYYDIDSTNGKYGLLAKAVSGIVSPQNLTSMTAVSIGTNKALSLSGSPSFVTNNINEAFKNFSGGSVPQTSDLKDCKDLCGMTLLQRLKLFWTTGNLGLLKEAEISKINSFVKKNFSGIGPISSAQGVGYRGSFGKELREAANIAVNFPENKVIAVTFGGWDHHNRIKELISKSSSELSDSLSQLRNDLIAGGIWNNTVVCVMSEFGRKVYENGVEGIDHGRGGIGIVMGGNVRGSRVITQVDLSGEAKDLNSYPLTVGDSQVPIALSNVKDEYLSRSSDALSVTVDYRQLFNTIFYEHLGVPSSVNIFRGNFKNKIKGIFKTS